MGTQSQKLQAHQTAEVFSYSKKRNPLRVRLSSQSVHKALQLENLARYGADSNRLFVKDDQLKRCNLLLLPQSKNYRVLLALGRNNREAI